MTKNKQTEYQNEMKRYNREGKNKSKFQQM